MARKRPLRVLPDEWQRGSFFELVYEVVRSVPPGRVTTYGAIAHALGAPRRAREVGWALASLPALHDVPSHRVVNAQGATPCRRGFGGPGGQRALLEDEGVEFDEHGHVYLDRYFWLPTSE